MPVASPLGSRARRVLKSQLVDLLVGPHGIDRYLELIRPDLTVTDARAEVIAVRRQTTRSVTLTLRPNGAWPGFVAGQFVRVGVEIDGVRRTRTYSPACSSVDSSGLLELTVTVHPDGLVSEHLRSRIAPGAILHLGAAQGDFVLPNPRPERLVLVSGGSGITPVISMLRTLLDEGHRGEIGFLHFSRTASDALYRPEVEELARRHRGVRVRYLATREGGARATRETLHSVMGADLSAVHAAVCGPPRLIDAMSDIWDALPAAGPLISETFTPPPLPEVGAAAQGTIRFVRSDRAVAIADGSLLEQAEAAGLSPDFGCRMGICHTCTCRKVAGTVQNIRTGELSSEEDEQVQLCVSIPAGDVALDI